MWYVKSLINRPRRLARFPLTLTLAAMHALSEMCRYVYLMALGLPNIREVIGYSDEDEGLRMIVDVVTGQE